LPGGWLYEDDFWCIGTYAHQIMPGIVIQLKRHLETVGEIGEAEWRALGPKIGAVSRAMESETAIERVYVVSFCETHRHRHFLVTPLAANVPAEDRGWDLWDHVRSAPGGYDPLRAPDVRARVFAAVRRELAAPA
jgi:diadenosine tetraphosphate (Ap4A) HIT family hydrolase